jgi:hypothetical protein
MTPDEYANLVLITRDDLFTAIKTALPAECETEKRFIQTGKMTEDAWSAALVNKTTDKIRIFVLLMTGLETAPEQRTAGAKNFKPSLKLNFELFHDHEQGTDADNSQTVFESDALKIQFAIESTRSLPPKAFIDSYNISLGQLTTNRSLHYGRGEIVINFREIRYE